MAVTMSKGRKNKKLPDMLSYMRKRSDMTIIDLENDPAEVLAEGSDFKSLLEAVEDVEKWGDRPAEVLDHVYRQRLIRFIRSEAGEEKLQEMIEHLDRVTRSDRLEALNHLEKAYGERWQAYMDLIDSQLAALSCDAPDMLLKRAHVKEILEMIASGRVDTRKEIQDRLHLRQPNLTRILNMMEANELIETQSVGREKRIRLGPMGRSRAISNAESDDPMPRGAKLLAIGG
jgi:DNA-binding MarR family transcriptional regulator